MGRRIAIATTTVAMVLVASPALACDTSAWLAHGPGAAPGNPLEISGGGFEPGTVELTWGEGGELLAEHEVGVDGRLSAIIDVPETAAGRTPVIAHTQHLEASDSPAHPAAWVDVVIPTPEAAPAAPSGAEVGQQSRSPATILLLALAGLIAASILAHTVWVRRQRPVGTQDPTELELQAIIAEERRRSHRPVSR